MKVFLVVMSVWDMAYRGMQITPAFVKEMPSVAACEAVAAAIEQMSYDQNKLKTRTKCVQI